MLRIVLRTFAVLAAFLPAACGSGTTIGGAPAPSQGSTTGPTGGQTPGASATQTPPAGSKPTASAAPTASPAGGATPSPGPTSSTLDLTCDTAPYPSTTYVQCETINYAMVSEAPAEQTQPAFVTALASQSTVNTQQWLARAEADSSWLDPLSGNTPQTPLCTTWGANCVGDPFRYANVAGPQGTAFYSQATVIPFVVYDSGCARMSGRVWAPASSAPGNALPNVVIENGSIEAPETLYWWAAQALVLDGYVVMTFDPRGQGRSDEQTPTGVQGGNINDTVFESGLVDAIDFFHSSPSKPYPNNVTCKETYPTTVAPYNPFWNRIDPNRLGIAGHSAGAAGVSIVQGYGGPGAAPWPGKIDSMNPVKVAVAWDGLLGPAGGDVGGIGSQSTAGDPKFTSRFPAMGNSSEYGLAPTLFATPPPAELHKAAFDQWVAAGTPVYEFTIRGSSHYDFSPITGFPATSWCPDAAATECSDGWGNPMSEYYTLAWFDRWLKLSGEAGYADADARLLDDNGPQGRNKMSWHFHSARSYPDRNGVMNVCSNIRSGCADTGNGPNVRLPNRR